MADPADAEPAKSSDAAQPPQAPGIPAGGATPPISPPQTDAAEAAAAGGATPEPKPGHKRKVALFMAYVGAGYMVRDERQRSSTRRAVLFLVSVCTTSCCGRAHWWREWD